MSHAAMPPLFLALLLAFVLTCPSAALCSEEASPVPDHVEKRFEAFASNWVAGCQKSFVHSNSKPDVSKDKEGVVVRYTAIDEHSISWRLKPTTSKDSPYVGILTYHRTDLESRGGSKAEAESKPFVVTRAVKVTEIFRYSKGNWQQ
jgi:hypothetical protein